MTDTDESLLNAFAGSRDERAFRELADRYLGLVFHTAMRRTNQRQIAEEVSQNILCALAQKASSLARNPDRLPAWLHRATLYESSKAMRAETSHQRRNRLHLPNESTPDDSPWTDAIPHLDAALDQLPDADRRVVLLHFFENRSFPGIARSLGKSTVAIQKQSQRALDKLARLLRAKGVTLTATTIAAGLSAEFAKAAPLTLVQSATAGVLTGSATYSTTSLTLMFAAKSKALVPLVILLCALPLALQYQAIFALERETTLLRAQLAAHDTAPGADPRQAKSAANSKGPGYWKKIGEESTEMERSTKGDLRVVLRFEQRLLTMTPEELVAGLDELNALGQSDTALVKKVLQRLYQQAPGMALTWSIDHLAQAGSRGVPREIADAFEKLLKQDPAKGIKWFDELIAAGKFDSTVLDFGARPRGVMEYILLRNLLAADVAAASRRMSALPEDQRTQILSRVSSGLLKEQEQLAFARLVRDQLPQSDQVSCISSQASHLVQQGGLAKVSEYLDRIDASPGERSACVEACAASPICDSGNGMKVTRDNVDVMREWVLTQAPDLPLDRITGTVLAKAARDRTVWVAAAELAAQYSQDSGNDDVLGRFLDCYVGGGWVQGKDAALVRTIAGKLSDSQRRDRILSQLK